MGKLAINSGKPVRTRKWPEWPVYDERELRMLEEVLRSRRWGGGLGKSEEKESELERKFAQFHDCKYGICICNGTAALHVALLAAGVGKGDEVIVPAITWRATGTAVMMVGAVPILVDIDPETYCLDANRIEEALTERTKAIIPVYNYGSSPDMDRIMEIAEDNDLVVIEDCARAHGFRWKNRSVGSIGDMGCFSFQQGKFMTAGEGGMIITNSREYMEKCHSIKDCGRIREGDQYSIGSLNWFNYRMTQFQAAILLVQLTRLAEQMERRDSNSRYLSERLEEIDGVEPIRIEPRLTKRHPWPFAFKYDPKQFNGASVGRICEALRAEGIPCDEIDLPLYDQIVFIKGTLPYRLYVEEKEKIRNRCPVADEAPRKTISIPQWVFLGTKSDMDDIVEAIIKIKENADEL